MGNSCWSLEKTTFTNHVVLFRFKSYLALKHLTLIYFGLIYSKLQYLLWKLNLNSKIYWSPLWIYTSRVQVLLNLDRIFKMNICLFVHFALKNIENSTLKCTVNYDIHHYGTRQTDEFILIKVKTTFAKNTSS